MRKSWISARIIIIIEMSELNKYRKVRETCEEDFLGSSEAIGPKTVESYFRLLQKLDLEILMNEIEISEEEGTIAALQFKLLLISDESKQSDQRRPVDSAQCEPVREMGCPVKGCKATFKKASSLRHHSMITHHLPNPHWKDRPVFKVFITKPSHSGDEDCLL